MKKLFFVAIMVLGLVNAACAAEEAVLVDGKRILITRPAISDTKYVLHGKDLTDGIYIRVLGNNNGCPFCGDSLPYAEVLVKGLFVEHGFKVVDKLEGASISIQFTAHGSMDIVAANNKAAHSNLPSSSKVISSIGAIAAGVSTGGIAAGVGYIAGAFIPTDEETELEGWISEKPELLHGFFGKTSVMSSVKGSDLRYSTGIKYRLEKEDKAPEDVILKLMAEQWINQHMVSDGIVSPTAVVNKTATESVSEAKM